MTRVETKRLPRFPGHALRLLLGAFCLVLGLCVASCGTEAPPPPTPTATAEGTPEPRLIIIPMGRTASNANAEVTIHGERTSDAEGVEVPPEGFVWRFFDITVANTGSEPFSLYLHHTHADGREFERAHPPTETAALNEAIAPGTEIRGEVAFLIEAETLGGILIYGPGEPAWALELGMPRQ